MITNQLFLKREAICTDPDGAMLGHILVPEERAGGQWILRKFSTLENPFLGNQRNISAIPDGVYPLIQRRIGRRFFEKYSRLYAHLFVPEIAQVPNRSAILCHIGNFARDTHGCVLIGYPNKSKNVKETMISNSTPAYKTFYNLLEKLYEKHPKLRIHISTLGEEKCSV